MARARVPADRQVLYLSELGRLAALARAAGAHLWVFRSCADPELFLEFREGADQPPLDDAVGRARLAALATYERPSGELWREQPLAAPQEG
ncbi:MAG: hypothetical protein MUC69_00480 [Gemmatimonadales bacterium]|nr:hypothetical protein [Gemmatimonadales bacterium]